MKELDITVVSARHLPKMDLMGTCDPFVELRFCGQLKRTTTVINSYRADWNETLRFLIPGAAAPPPPHCSNISCSRVACVKEVPMGASPPRTVYPGLV